MKKTDKRRDTSVIIRKARLREMGGFGEIGAGDTGLSILGLLKHIVAGFDRDIQFMYDYCICRHKRLISLCPVVSSLEWIWWLRTNIETGAS